MHSITVRYRDSILWAINNVKMMCQMQKWMLSLASICIPRTLSVHIAISESVRRQKLVRTITLIPLEIFDNIW